jgi:hypothetical protein
LAIFGSGIIWRRMDMEKDDKSEKDSKSNGEELLKVLGTIIRQLKESGSISREELLSLFDEDSFGIPVSVFSHKLGPLEALVKFLKEDMEMHYSEIAKLLGRDDRGIWASYHKAAKKLPQRFEIHDRGMIPVSLFSDRRLSVLEHLVRHLRDSHKIKVQEISGMLNRKQGTIWAAYHHAKVKLKS